MATWRKIIVSGSDAELRSLDVTTDIAVGSNQVISTSSADTKLSGSFTGSFTGNVTATTFSFDIDTFGADLSANTLSGTDLILISSGGVDGHGTISQLAVPLAGTGLESDSGTIRVASTAAGNGLTGGSGVALSVDTGSTHFTNGVKQKLNVEGVVSSSAQIDVRNTTGIATIATTGSNTFTGVQTISNTTNSTTYADGALVISGGLGVGKDVNISGSLTVTGLLTAVTMSTQYVTSSQYTVGTSRIILNDDDLVRFAGISVIDSGSTAGSGSLLWDSFNNRWIYENETSGDYNSAVIIAGPKNYGSLGNETGLVAGRIPVATGDDHIDTNVASSSLYIDFATQKTYIEHGLYVTGSVTASAGIKAADLYDTSLTQDRVVLIGASGKLIDNAGFTFNGTDFNLSSSGQFTLTNGGNVTVNTGGDFSVSASSGEVSLEATDGITLSSPTSPIVLSGSETQVNSNLRVQNGDIILTNGAISASAFTGSFIGTFEGDIPAYLYITASNGSTSTIDLQTQALTLATGSATPENITITAAGQTVTFALTDNVTVAKKLTASTGSFLGNVVVDGDLTVNGTTTTISTQNLLVEDKFVLLSSGSVSSNDGGIIIDAGSGTGHALFYDNDATRWGVNESVSYSASSAAPTAYVAQVVDMQVAAQAAAVTTYSQLGNIKIDNGEIYIWA